MIDMKVQIFIEKKRSDMIEFKNKTDTFYQFYEKIRTNIFM
jgi:hypothetical protein